MAIDFLHQSRPVGYTARSRADKKSTSRRKMIGNAILSEEGTRLFTPITIERRRQNEIEEIIRLRHGPRVPDPSGTDDHDMCISYAKAIAMTPRIQRVDEWCSKWMPWIDQATASVLAKKQSARRFMAKADHVAKMLSVTMELRAKLDLRTIGACDVSEADRKAQAAEHKRLMDIQRKQQKRRADGSVSRSEYEGKSLSKSKPWEAEGMSRRTWYRRQKQVGTSPALIDIDISVSGALVPDASEVSEISQIPFQEDIHSKVTA